MLTFNQFRDTETMHAGQLSYVDGAYTADIYAAGICITIGNFSELVHDRLHAAMLLYAVYANDEALK